MDRDLNYMNVNVLVFQRGTMIHLTNLLLPTKLILIYRIFLRFCVPEFRQIKILYIVPCFCIHIVSYIANC